MPQRERNETKIYANRPLCYFLLKAAVANPTVGRIKLSGKGASREREET